MSLGPSLARLKFLALTISLLQFSLHTCTHQAVFDEIIFPGEVA
jgi:hypothetical protein